MSDEDPLVNALIESAQDDRSEEMVERVDIHPEAHYNHYGDRGVVDLAIYKWTEEVHGRPAQVDIYEVKGASAIEQATGANEIIRQFNHAREYFLRDETNSRAKRVHNELTFVPSRTAVSHVVDNFQMYREAKEEKIQPVSGDVSYSTKVLFRSVEDLDPIPLPSSRYTNVKSPRGWYEFLDSIEVVTATNEQVKKHLEAILFD